MSLIPFITLTVRCLPIVAANDEHHNPLPLPPFLFICLCRYYSNLCESILMIPIISLITLVIALSVGNFRGEWWWEGVAQRWSRRQGAMETHTSLTAAALLPRCQQFGQITRAVTLCHKDLKESDQILFRFRLLNRPLPVDDFLSSQFHPLGFASNVRVAAVSIGKGFILSFICRWFQWDSMVVYGFRNAWSAVTFRRSFLFLSTWFSPYLYPCHDWRWSIMEVAGLSTQQAIGRLNRSTAVG